MSCFLFQQLLLLRSCLLDALLRYLSTLDGMATVKMHKLCVALMARRCVDRLWLAWLMGPPDRTLVSNVTLTNLLRPSWLIRKIYLTYR